MNTRRRNLRDVVSFEVRRTLTKKRFWLATLLVPALIVIVFAISIASGSSSDNAAQQQSDSPFRFEYTDPANLIDPDLARAAGGSVVGTEAQGIARVKDGVTEAYFAYPEDPVNDVIDVYGINKGIFDNGKYADTATALLRSSAADKIGSPQLTAIVQGAADSRTTAFEDGQVAGGIESVIPPMLYVVLLYIVIILMGNQMLSATVEEKENRVTEMILTTIRAKTLLVGKVISLFIIGFVQMLVFVVPIALGFTFFREQIAIPDLNISALQFDAGTLVTGALLLLASFSLFTATLVAIGAAMPTVKDAAPFYTGVVLILFLPLYTVSMIVTSSDAPIVQAFTLFPYTAPVTALLRNALGSLTVWMAVVDIVVMFALAAVILQVAVGIFRYGSIEYGKKVSLKAVLHARRDR